MPEQQAHSAPQARNIFHLLKDAITGAHKEFTTGSIDKAIFMLSVPMILEMVMESLFAVVDAFFVGKLGEGALATVGLTESVLTIMYSLAMGLSMAATAMVSRRTGEKNLGEAAHAAVQAIYLGLGVAVVIGISGVIFAKDILHLMGAEPAVVEGNFHYTQIMMGSNIIIMLLFLINGIFRGAGDASISMRALWLANILNIILCPTLINGLGPIPAMGLTGAALATTIGRGCGVIFQFYHLSKGRGNIKILRKHLDIDWPIIRSMIKIAAGGVGQFMINSVSWIFLTRIISSFGMAAVAGYTIGIRVIIFSLLPAWGMSNAAAALVGQNLGAKQPDRAEKSVWRAAFLNMLFLVSVGLIFFLGAEKIIHIFSRSPMIIDYGVQTLRYICLGYIFYGYGMVVIQAFNGAGDTFTPTIINLCGFWAFQIPLAYVLAIILGLGPKGVFLAIAIAESAITIAAMVLFKRGKWKKISI